MQFGAVSFTSMRNFGVRPIYMFIIPNGHKKSRNIHCVRIMGLIF